MTGWRSFSRPERKEFKYLKYLYMSTVKYCEIILPISKVARS